MRQLIYSLLVTIAISAFPASLNAAEIFDHSSNVFRFQQKLAENGNAGAQYKLAMMYETGDGVKASFDKALNWYGRAAKSGLKKAEQRNTYLMVKELGFDKSIHAEWLSGIKADASNREPAAMLLLGQLYSKGIGVKKNLPKSLDLLGRVSILGDADVDAEIEAIYAEIDAAKKSRRVAVSKKKKTKVAARKPAAKPVAKPVTKTASKVKVSNKIVAKKKVAKPVTTAKVEKKPTKKERIMAEKRRRYEAAMKQLALEQKMIDDQQASVTGNAVAAIDDEF